MTEHAQRAAAARVSMVKEQPREQRMDLSYFSLHVLSRVLHLSVCMLYNLWVEHADSDSLNHSDLSGFSVHGHRWCDKLCSRAGFDRENPRFPYLLWPTDHSHCAREFDPEDN
jgi:hypothetical protein